MRRKMWNDKREEKVKTIAKEKKRESWWQEKDTDNTGEKEEIITE